ncbi:hypothetical protein Tco_1292743 [Tanacetum coccineum]
MHFSTSVNESQLQQHEVWSLERVHIGGYLNQAVKAWLDGLVITRTDSRTKYICQSFKGKTRSLVTKKTDISYVRSSRNSNLMNMLQMMSVHISSGLVLHLDDRSLLHDNIVPKPDLALELGKSISLTEAEEEAVARESYNKIVTDIKTPTRTDEQIVPRSQWLIIEKSNLLFNAQKIQKNPIFQISVDILSNTNFFRAFTASANVPAIYLQQFWNTMKYDEKTGVYRCQIDEQWFDLSVDLLRKALAITPVIPAQPFELPPGIVTQTNVDHAELIWEEFTHGIQTFFSCKASHKASLKNPKKKVTPLLIPYGRFSKVIIYYLASNNNIHQRPNSAVHHIGDDFILGNLKFVPKGESVKVFGMEIPDPLITEAIQQSSYYHKYLEMVAENTKKTPQESASMQPATKHATPKKPTTTTPVKQSKPAPTSTKKPSKQSVPQEEGDDPDLELAKKMSLEAYQEKGEGEGDDADMERAIKLSLDPAFLPQGRAPVGGVTIRDPVSETTPKLPEVVGKGKVIITEEQVAHSLIDLSKKKRNTDQFILVRRDQAPHDSTTRPFSQPEDDTSEKVIHESSSTSDSEQTKSETEAAAPKGDKDQGEVDSSRVTSGVSIPVSTQGQAGSDSGKVYVSLAGPNPEHMDDEFLATAYPKVHENLKLITDERVIEDNPESHSGSMSSMKNLEDTDNFGDQFLYDKPTEDDQEKSKVVDESDSTIPDPSHQTVTSTPLVIAPVTDFSSPKPSSLVTPPPINMEATNYFAFRDSFIVSKKRSSDSSKKLKGPFSNLPDEVKNEFLNGFTEGGGLDCTLEGTRSIETSGGLAAIQAQLNNLGREIKKVNEKVYVAQVGCEQCKGPHYIKDFPLKEEGKTLEEAYYT